MLPFAGTVQESLDHAVRSCSLEALQAPEPEAQPESVPATPIGLTLGKRRPLIDLSDLSDFAHSSDLSEPPAPPPPSNSPDSLGATLTGTVDDIPHRNFWEPAAPEPGFAMFAGSCPATWKNMAGLSQRVPRLGGRICRLVVFDGAVKAADSCCATHGAASANSGHARGGLDGHRSA